VVFCASHMISRSFRMLTVCLIAGSVFNTGGKENRGVGGKKGYIYLSSCFLVHILRFVG
jgi:hypothetical protein